MPLFTASLNSGSNGNCYYIGDGRDAVLVDAGISCRETEKRMNRLGLSIEKVRAIFITHEHSDHIAGVEVLSKRHSLPVYISESTYRNSGLDLRESHVRYFNPDDAISVGGLEVRAFTKRHDAADPFSFVVSGDGVHLGVMTDIGSCCENVIHHFKSCHAVYLETNYDPLMLEKGRYPRTLKNRIRGGKGHLSNYQALELFVTYKPPHMSHVFLSHLSKDNNDPSLALEVFRAKAEKVHVAVASRYEESEVYKIESQGLAVDVPVRSVQRAVQLSLL